MRKLAWLVLTLVLFIAPYDDAAAQRGPRGARPAPAEPAADTPAAEPEKPAAEPSGPVRGRARGAPPPKQPAAEAHARVYANDPYPSAVRCASCHERIYEEWRASNHAYAGISPMFHKFEQKISDLAPTIGTFCVRCHMSVATTKGEARDAPLWARTSQVSREGVTCITCHRVKEAYTKVNGERRIEPGSIYDPVYGPFDGEGVANVVRNKGQHRVATSDAEIGRSQPIHTAAVEFEQITKSEFCVSCHQVAVNLGIKLEVVWDQYRASPAHAKGVACQECHMGKVPGRQSGFNTGPAAEAMTGGRALNPNRKQTNHAFYGPGDRKSVV